MNVPLPTAQIWSGCSEKRTSGLKARSSEEERQPRLEHHCLERDLSGPHTSRGRRHRRLRPTRRSNSILNRIGVDLRATAEDRLVDVERAEESTHIEPNSWGSRRGRCHRSGARGDRWCSPVLEATRRDRRSRTYSLACAGQSATLAVSGLGRNPVILARPRGPGAVAQARAEREEATEGILLPDLILDQVKPDLEPPPRGTTARPPRAFRRVRSVRRRPARHSRESEVDREEDPRRICDGVRWVRTTRLRPRRGAGSGSASSGSGSASTTSTASTSSTTSGSASTASGSASGAVARPGLRIRRFVSWRLRVRGRWVLAEPRGPRVRMLLRLVLHVTRWLILVRRIHLGEAPAREPLTNGEPRSKANAMTALLTAT